MNKTVDAKYIATAPNTLTRKTLPSNLYAPHLKSKYILHRSQNRNSALAIELIFKKRHEPNRSASLNSNC
ncbi:hypothetical protein FHX05_005708 [Rhizobium sp. BK491]|nr:hypothetical protein [Rhizobium sp. BK491]